MPVINSIAALKDEAAGWRHELHQNPQTGYEEVFASEFVAAKLTEWKIPFERGWATTGIVATIEGNRKTSGRAIALRADMDALNIVEQSGVPYASKNPGKMHACGHDGHTSTLLAAAKYLNETRNFDGTVKLIFQPAEEGGGGAIKMVAEGLFAKHPVDAVFAFHNWPYMALGKIGMRAGPMMASADHFEINVTGQGCHAAMPHLGVDPILVSAHIITALQSIVSRNINAIDQGVVTVSNIQAGTGADNIIAGTAYLNGTIRAFNQEVRLFLHKRAREIVEQVAKAFMAEAEFKLHLGYDPTINTAAEIEIAARAAREVAGEQNVFTDVEPTMGAEDFGAFLQQKPGAYIVIGQGTGDVSSPHDHGLHSPFYDFNDEILPIGASYFARLVETYLK